MCVLLRAALDSRWDGIAEHHARHDRGVVQHEGNTMNVVLDNATRSLEAYVARRNAKGHNVEIEEITLRRTTSDYSRGVHRGDFGYRYVRARINVNGKVYRVYTYVMGDDVWGGWKYA
jgi:hypothetical protein